MTTRIHLGVILGFCPEIDENCTLLGYYAASSGNFLPTFGTAYRSHLEGSSLHSMDREIFNFAYMAKGEQIAKYLIPASVDKLHIFVSDSRMSHSSPTRKGQLCLSYDLGSSPRGLVEG